MVVIERRGLFILGSSALVRVWRRSGVPFVTSTPPPWGHLAGRCGHVVE